AILDDAHALAPYNEARTADLARTLGAAAVTDEEVFDPAGLVAYRLAGYSLLVWSTTANTDWIEPIARARALELRLYVVVFDAGAKRAFAVDPHGVAVAGTFDDYRLASFTLDPRRTIETTVAPGTDVREGLERVESIVRNREPLSS
ncbi:MAG: hypothetical protein JOZ01_05625, partial [Candidatus Eremiobacteraeota bacterium]|nr:hypothetical protein [Candidatus Eremiobacteraeota bacterium]